MKKLYLIGLLILSYITGFSQADKPVDWKKDIECLKKELPKKHKYLFFQMSKEEFEKKLDDISSHLNLYNDFAVAIKLQQTIASIGDSHTGVWYNKLIDAEKKLPLNLYWFSDGIYVLQTTKEYEKLLGTRISKVNNFSIPVIVDSLSTLITIDNQALVKNNIPKMIPTLQLLEHFGFSKDSVLKVEVETPHGHLVQCDIKAGAITKENEISIQPDSVAVCFQNQQSFFSEKYFADEGIYYLQYNTCYSSELAQKYGRKRDDLPSFVEFETKVFDVIQNKPINRLIFDMRFNGGGNSTQGTEFITKLAGYDIAKQDKKFYVVIGRQTFSSAIINTMDFKRLTKAIFVGEETGGKPNHYGEVRDFMLPSSGLAVYYSTKYFAYTKENLKTIKPDVTIETSFSDYKKGVDPVYEWIKKQ